MENQKKKLKAIHRLLIEGRSLSLKGEFDKIPELFDKVEYLIALIIGDNDQSEFFEEYLEGTCIEFDVLNIYLNYSKK